MTIWEKVIVNLEKGSKKLTFAAELLSERIRAEIAIARLRIRTDEVKSLINEQYRIIGRSVAELKKKDALPPSTDQLVNEEDIITALAEITSREKDLEDLYNEIANEQSAFKVTEKHKEETTQ